MYIQKNLEYLFLNKSRVHVRFKEKQIEIIKKIEFDTTQINKNGYYDLLIITKNKNSTSVEVFEYDRLEGYVPKE